MSLTEKSLKRLEGVDKRLRDVVLLAAERHEFVVIEGLRTQERQAELVARGSSITMNSRHLVGMAVDVAPLLGGQPSWDWNLFYPIAEAMKLAAQQLGVSLTWGGVWDRPLNSLGDPHEESSAYIERERARKIAAGKKPSVLVDGPHFELVRNLYPTPTVTP